MGVEQPLPFTVRKMKKKYHSVLTIAGSDSSGGAGIQADLKTFSALGCYGMSVVTALTAQNTRGIKSVSSVPAAFIEDQLEAVFNDMGVDAVKIGMLHRAEAVETVARQLKKYSAENVVFDPVMVAQSGEPLLQDEALEAVKDCLMPIAEVFTPNLPEASILLDRQINTVDDMKKAALELAYWGAGSVLLKGGHLTDKDSTDILYIRKEERFVEFSAERIVTRNNHGTGCTLSSAVASCLAKGIPIENAVKKAKAYLTKALRAGSEYDIGGGHGPVHHFHEFW